MALGEAESGDSVSPVIDPILFFPAGIDKLCLWRCGVHGGNEAGGRLWSLDLSSSGQRGLVGEVFCLEVQG